MMVGELLQQNTCREPCGWFDHDHVSTSSIPSIVHSVVVEGGQWSQVYPHVLPRAVLAWCYDGIRYYKPATNAAA